MASTEVHYLGCGIDISSSAGNRLLLTEKSHVVVPLWSYLCCKELENRGLVHEQLAILDLVFKNSVKMCQKCFNTYNRCIQLIKKLKNPVLKALDVLQNNGRLQLSVDNDLMEVENDEIPCICDNGHCIDPQRTPSCSQFNSPKPKRLCLESAECASVEESPAVMVCDSLYQ